MTRTFAFLLAGLLAAPLLAAEDAAERIRAYLEPRLNGASVGDISPSPLPGVWQVVVASEVFYVSEDGRYILQGRLVDIEERRDMTEPVLRDVRRSIVERVPESMMIVFEPDGDARHTLTIFTDIDCPYCRRMHAEIDELNAAGVRVRYMLYPRSGIGTPSHAKAVEVWCAEDRNEALTLAKQGVDLPSADCTNPIREHMAVAQQLGLTGTPFSITDTGEKISGYAPVARLVQRLDASKAELASVE